MIDTPIQHIYLLNTGIKVTSNPATWTEDYLTQPDTAYLLVDNKYVITGSGASSDYVGRSQKIYLNDDSNESTPFKKPTLGSVTFHTNNLALFRQKLPASGCPVYVMK